MTNSDGYYFVRAKIENTGVIDAILFPVFVLISQYSLLESRAMWKTGHQHRLREAG